MTTLAGTVKFFSYSNGDTTPTALSVQVVSENNSSAPWYNWGGTGNVLRGDNYIPGAGVNLIRIQLPSAVNAFAADLMYSGPQPKAVRVKPGGVNVGAGTTFGDGYVSLTSVAISGSPGQKLFFGVSQDTPFTYVDIVTAVSSISEYALLDNVAFGNLTTGTPDPTAEPATLFSLGSGIAMLWMAWKWRRPQAAV